MCFLGKTMLVIKPKLHSEVVNISTFDKDCLNFKIFSFKVNHFLLILIDFSSQYLLIQNNYNQFCLILINLNIFLVI